MWLCHRGWSPWVGVGKSLNILGLACILLILSASSVLGTDVPKAVEYLESYAKGLEAYGNQEWVDAALWFRQAIDEKPKAGGEVAAAGESHIYVPYHQLALALYFGDSLEDAEVMWLESEAQGVLAKERPEELESVKEYRLDIAKRIEERKRMREKVNNQLQRADRQIVMLDEPDKQLALDEDSVLAQKRQAAIERLERARKLYELPRANESQLSEAHILAVQAAAALESVALKASSRP